MTSTSSLSPERGNLYAPPAAATQRFEPDDGIATDVDRELEAIELTTITKAAILLVAATSALLVLAAIQLFGVLRLRGVYRAAPYVMLLLGTGGFVLAVKVYKQRVWATLTATVASAVVAMAMGIWFVIASLGGFISLLGLITPVLAVVAAVFAGLSIGPSKRTAAARRRLAASGLDVDF
jgi:hypothetical protein